MLTLTDDKLLKFVLIWGKSCVVFVWGEKLGWPRTLFIILLKKTSVVDAENKLESIYKNKYRINLDHQILTDHGAFYPQALYNNLFELTLAPASQVVMGSDASKLVYKLTNIQLEYEVIRSKQLVNLGFRARHDGISVWVLTQQITSIAEPFRENVAAIVLFYTPFGKTTKAIFEDYAGEITHEEYKELIAWLKERRFSHLVFSLRYPYGIETQF